MTCLGVKHKTQDLCPRPCGQSGRVTFDPFSFQRLVLSPSLSAARRFTRRRLSSSRPSRHVMERFEHRSNPVYNIPNTSCIIYFLLEILNQRIRNKKKITLLHIVRNEGRILRHILLYFHPDDVFNEPGQYCPVCKSGFTHHHQFEKAEAN